VSTALHRECPPWAKWHLGPHINCHLMCWRVSNNTPTWPWCATSSMKTPPATLSTLPTAATAHYHCQLLTPTLAHACTYTNHDGNNECLLDHGEDDVAPQWSPWDVPHRPDGDDGIHRAGEYIVCPTTLFLLSNSHNPRWVSLRNESMLILG